VCFCAAIAAGAQAGFRRDAALKENSSAFWDTTARGVDCHNTDVFWARYSPRGSKRASPVQHAQLCRSPLRPPVKPSTHSLLNWRDLDLMGGLFDG